MLSDSEEDQDKLPNNLPGKTKQIQKAERGSSKKKPLGHDLIEIGNTAEVIVKEVHSLHSFLTKLGH